MNDAKHFNDIFTRTVSSYHHSDEIMNRINNPFISPYGDGTMDNLLYWKSWIDSVQWDLEDLIRNPDIAAEKALQLKRRIDKSNQERTDVVEKIDDAFFEKYKNIEPKKEARTNTESIAWALDRLSILALKIYHMGLQTKRKNTNDAHREKCKQKLNTLRIQQEDLIRAINELIEDVEKGERIIKVYRQMKMYNDPTLNPVLYAAQKEHQ